MTGTSKVALEPNHYKRFGVFEPFNVIEAWGLSYHCGDAIAYIARAPYKGRQIEDLEKAVVHLQREIKNLRARS